MKNFLLSISEPAGSHSGKKKSYHYPFKRLLTGKSDEETLSPIELHHFEAVFGADFVLHAV